MFGTTSRNKKSFFKWYKLLFLAHIPLFLYPFLNTSNKAKPFENLRVTSLGVIGALVKGDDSEAIHFLM